MARRYELVGCYYDRYQKQKYKDESVIKIDGVSLKKLDEIDLYTTSMDFMTFKEQLKEEDKEKNLFSIRVTDTKNENVCYYLPTIFDDKRLYNALKDRTSKKVSLPNGIRTLLLLPYGNPLLYETFRPIQEILEEGNIDAIEDYVSINSSYGYQLLQFMKSDQSDEEAQMRLQQLKQEFCHYPVFRSIYTYRKKPVYHVKINQNALSMMQEKKTVVKKDLFDVINDSNNEERIWNQGVEKEEFLDIDELTSMGYLPQEEKRKIYGQIR